MKKIISPSLATLFLGIIFFAPPAYAQVSVDGGGTGLTAVPAGALLYGSDTNPLTVLNIGLEGSILSTVNGTPAWISPLALPVLHLQMNEQGDMRFGSGISTQIGYYPSTVIGKDAYANGGGYGHTVLGWGALQRLVGGEWNVAVGGGAGGDLGQGAGNTFVGGSTGTVGNTHESWSGNFNTFVGFNAGSNISPTSPTLNNNTIVGSYAADGQNLSGGDYNILLGSRINLPLDGGSHQLNIGNVIFGTDISGTGYAVSPGRIGIGTPSPSARLSVHANEGESNPVLFDVTAGSPSAPTSFFAVNDNGHHIFRGPRPTLTACGNSASVVGTDVRGRIVVGTGAGTHCALVFAHAWDGIPVCQITKETGPFRSYRVVPTASGFSITASGGIGADTPAYACDGI